MDRCWVVYLYAKSAPKKTVITPMVKRPAVLTMPLLVPRPVAVGEGELVEPETT